MVRVMHYLHSASIVLHMTILIVLLPPGDIIKSYPMEYRKTWNG